MTKAFLGSRARRCSTAVAAALLAWAVSAQPAQASVSQGGVYGSGVVTDDWGDEGPLSVNSNSHNNVVLLWQVVLVSDGYLGSAADYDCRFGPRTQAATKAWQRANGLDDDGIVGPLTFGKADNKLRMDSDDGEIHYKGSRGIYRNSSGRWYMDDVNGVRHYFSYTSSSMCN